MKNYKYFKENDTLYRVRVEVDTDPESPRAWDCNLGTMICWHRNYSLGDSHDYNSPDDFVNSLIRENLNDKTIINFIKNKKASNGLELRYNRNEKLWELWGYYYWSLFGEKREPKFGLLEASYPVEFLVDEIVESMSLEDKWKLLEKHAGIVFLPLYLYDHSGITMNTTGFSCPWDSGQVGYVYTDKETILSDGISFKDEKGNYILATNKNWKKAAYFCLEGEVRDYDMYLKNEVYGYIVDEYLPEEKEWSEYVDSCWGYYSDNYGDALVEEIAKEYTSAPLFDTMEELVAC